VNHPYVYHDLQKFGFGRTFIRNVRIACLDTQGMIKIDCTLTSAFRYARGVLQGTIRPTAHTHQ
jgi:hypothetical protein